MYAKMIEEARAKGLTSDKIMVASIADVEELLHKVREMDETLYWRFIKKQHEHMFGCHYNENFGEWRIKQMHYKDKAGTEHHAPHWPKDQYKTAYESVKAKLPPTYNCWDFAVTLEMLYSDDICMYRRWWPEATEEQLEGKVVEAAVNYLSDDDDPDCKIWHRFEK
jgi:hypothetical protein